MTTEQVSAWLLTRENFLILTHVRPDGDTVGCAAGLCHALRERGKTAWVLENTEATSLFTPYLEGLLAPADFVPDTVITVDTAASSMVPDNAQGYLARGIDLAIDHHPSQEFYARETCLCAQRAACGEIVYEIIAPWGAPSAAVALPLYMAVATDTGCFVYGNTTAHTHRVAAALMESGIDFKRVNKRHFRTRTFKRLRIEGLLAAGASFYDDGRTAIAALTDEIMAEVGASKEDIDDISAFVGQIEGVKVAITLRQTEQTAWKLSLRTEPEDLNAGDVCAHFGGGGHAAAAGGLVHGTLSQAKEAVLTAIETVRAQAAPQ